MLFSAEVGVVPVEVTVITGAVVALAVKGVHVGVDRVGIAGEISLELLNEQSDPVKNLT